MMKLNESRRRPAYQSSCRRMS